MARERALRPERRAPPFSNGGQKPRAVGRTRRRMPRVRAPKVGAGWRRLGIFIAVVGAAVAGGWWLYESPLLAVQDVEVQGNVVVSTDLVRSVAALEGGSIVRLGFEDERERLMAIPLVKEARITRDWPNGIDIAIVERQPWGLWQVGDARYVIDEEGYVLDLPAPLDAPVVHQTDAPPGPVAVGDQMDPGAVAVARELVSSAEQTLGRSVLSLQFSQARGLTAVLDGDASSALQVAFGDAQGLEFKVAALYAVLQDAQEQGRSLSRVDLRFGDRIAVQ